MAAISSSSTVQQWFEPSLIEALGLDVLSALPIADENIVELDGRDYPKIDPAQMPASAVIGRMRLKPEDARPEDVGTIQEGRPFIAILVTKEKRDKTIITYVEIIFRRYARDLGNYVASTNLITASGDAQLSEIFASGSMEPALWNRVKRLLKGEVVKNTITGSPIRKAARLVLPPAKRTLVSDTLSSHSASVPVAPPISSSMSDEKKAQTGVPRRRNANGEFTNIRFPFKKGEMSPGIYKALFG